jgi:hypothetical protein
MDQHTTTHELRSHPIHVAFGLKLAAHRYLDDMLREVATACPERLNEVADTAGDLLIDVVRTIPDESNSRDMPYLGRAIDFLRTTARRKEEDHEAPLAYEPGDSVTMGHRGERYEVVEVLGRNLRLAHRPNQYGRDSITTVVGASDIRLLTVAKGTR